MLLKNNRLRSAILRNAARDQACVRCGDDTPGAVVLAHLPDPGDAMGMKAPDWKGAHLCCNCHAWADIGDGRRDWPARHDLIIATLARLFDNKVIVVSAGIQ